jgi:hypothetical protein
MEEQMAKKKISDGIYEFTEESDHKCDTEGFMPRMGTTTTINLYPALYDKLTNGTGSLNAKINALLAYALKKLERDHKRLVVNTEELFPCEVPKGGRRQGKRLTG